MSKKQDLIGAVKKHALEFGDFTLKSGRKSHFYLDCRKLTLSTDVALVVDSILEIADTTEFDAVGGPCVGADPIVGAFLALANNFTTFRGFLIRKEGKEHGKSGLVIGSVKPGDECLVVEDVTTSGGSLLRAVQVIQEFGCTVKQVVSIVDREEGAVELFLEHGIKFTPLLTLSDLGIGGPNE